MGALDLTPPNLTHMDLTYAIMLHSFGRGPVILLLLRYLRRVTRAAVEEGRRTEGVRHVDKINISSNARN
jgi:hypothetical protein